MEQQRAAREACNYSETTVRQVLSYGYLSVIYRFESLFSRCKDNALRVNYKVLEGLQINAITNNIYDNEKV